MSPPRAASHRRAIGTFSHTSIVARIPVNIFANTIVTIQFRLFDASNQLLEESPEPLTYMHGGHSGIEV